MFAVPKQQIEREETWCATIKEKIRKLGSAQRIESTISPSRAVPPILSRPSSISLARLPKEPNRWRFREINFARPRLTIASARNRSSFSSKSTSGHQMGNSARKRHWPDVRKPWRCSGDLKNTNCSNVEGSSPASNVSAGCAAKLSGIAGGHYAPNHVLVRLASIRLSRVHSSRCSSITPSNAWVKT